MIYVIFRYNQRLEQHTPLFYTTSLEKAREFCEKLKEELDSIPLEIPDFISWLEMNDTSMGEVGLGSKEMHVQLKLYHSNIKLYYESHIKDLLTLDPTILSPDTLQFPFSKEKFEYYCNYVEEKI
jgi:hypothetical protein